MSESVISRVSNAWNCWGHAATVQCTVSLVQWVNHLLPSHGGSGFSPGDAPTLTMELGSPISDVPLHWWPQRDWSLASPLARCFTMPLATWWQLMWSHITYLPPFHSARCRSLLFLTTYWPVRAPVKLWGGGRGAWWRSSSYSPIHCLSGPVGQL